MRGGDKLMEDVGGAPLISVMAERCLAVGPTRVVVDPTRQKRMTALQDNKLELVHSTGPDMSDSLKAGLRGLKSQAALVVLADMPGLQSSDLVRFIQTMHDNPDHILRARNQNGQPGHPVLFPASLFSEFEDLVGDQGAAPILKRHKDRILWIKFQDDRVTEDLDTPEDWASWRAKQ